MSKLILLFVLSFPIFLLAQPDAQPVDPAERYKQSMYCQPAIRWAGIVDVDVLPDPDPNLNWDSFRKSGFSSLNYKQYTATSPAHAPELTQHLLDAIKAKKLMVYETSRLARQKELGEGDLYYLPAEAEGKTIEYEAEDFQILRLKCLIYYRENGGGFGLTPIAAMIVRPEWDYIEYDGKPLYRPLGWIKIQQGKAAQPAWSKVIHTDVKASSIQVFKLDWTYEQTVKDLLHAAQSNANTTLYSVQALDGTPVLTKEQLQELSAREDFAFDPETFEEYQVRVPKESFDLVGMTISTELMWDDGQHQLYLQATQFAPLIHNMDIFCDDCDGVNMFLERLFWYKKEDAARE